MLQCCSWWRLQPGAGPQLQLHRQQLLQAAVASCTHRPVPAAAAAAGPILSLPPPGIQHQVLPIVIAAPRNLYHYAVTAADGWRCGVKTAAGSLPRCTAAHSAPARLVTFLLSLLYLGRGRAGLGRGRATGLLMSLDFLSSRLGVFMLSAI